jgi:DNA-directed RNA polymerase specialized sigma24 family protein
MIKLSMEQIADAKANDLSAVTAVIEATEERVQQLAYRHASIGGRIDQDLREDLAQIGRMNVWEAIKRFEGTTVAEFFVFIDSTVDGQMSNERKRDTRQGVSRDTAARFEIALSAAEGDAYKAEKLAQTTEVMGRRPMSADRAYAARLAYQGVQYLDAPATGDSGEGFSTFGEMLADVVGVPVDLLEPSDFEKARRRETRDKVHATLDRMGFQARTVLKGMTGIDPVGFYGTEHDEELAADFGIPRDRIRTIRSLGRKRFAELYTFAN